MAAAKRAFAAGDVRCATLIGHVDHGKSSYADSLLAANGIISARQAGKLRYLDAREDEQQRGITMESSAVSLGFKMRERRRGGEQPGDPDAGAGTKAKGDAKPSPSPSPSQPQPLRDYMINLIDTPGHVDFGSEVSSASRLCDGALVIVDVVEGVCTQTIAVLRQAWQDRLSPILVLNKMDRLVTELKLSPSEAYHHLVQLLENVNAIMGSFFASERMEDDLRWHEAREKRLKERRERRGDEVVGGAGGEGAAVEGSEEEEDAAYEELDDEDIYFDPGRGNVIFASAIDGWAFRLERFAHLHARKLGLQEAKLRRVLWGDFYFDPKSRRVMGHRQKEREKRNLKVVFVQFVLENVWAVYEAAAARDQAKLEKIVAALELRVQPRDLRSKDTQAVVQAIFSQWLPLAPCTFAALVSNVPSPADAQARRIPKMLQPELSYFSKVEPSTDLERDLFAAKSGTRARRCAYVSKMFAVRRDELPEAKRREVTAEEMRERGKEARERARAAAASAPSSAAHPGEGAHETPAGVPLAEASKVTSEAQIREQDKDPQQLESGPGAATQQQQQQSDEVILGFARLYSGTLRVGQSLWALLPKYQTHLPPSHPNNAKHLRRISVTGLYMMMGRDLAAVTEVPAGNVFAIAGLEGVVLRNATLCAPPETDEEGPTGVVDGGEAHGEKDLPDTALASDCFVNLSGVYMLSAPIVRVALEPVNPADMPKLVEGLKLLNQADPCVETLVQATGEHVIITAGELHLERCLKDLRERFARCAIQASAPLVPFRETAVRAAEMPPPKTEGAQRGTIHATVGGSVISLTVRAAPFPTGVTELLQINQGLLRRMMEGDRRRHGQADGDDDDDHHPNHHAGVEHAPSAGTTNGRAPGTGPDDEVTTSSSSSSSVRVRTPQAFWAKLEELLAKAGPQWRETASQVWAFGPRRVGPNLLVDHAGLLAKSLRARTEMKKNLGDGRPSSGLPTPPPQGNAERTAKTASAGDELSSALQAASLAQSQANGEAADSGADAGAGATTETLAWTVRDLLDAVETGFQIATLQGPMCAEPVQGLAFFVERLDVDAEAARREGGRLRLSQATGSLISSMREACRGGLLDWSPRLMMAMYSCDIQASPDVLGKVHGVLSRRRGRITSEEMREGTSFFTVGAVLPVVESFGFADEIRKRTSGQASPQLIFKGFELFDIDPFWVPRTEEELEDLGEKGERENVAKRYMDQVRKRKGMFVDERIVGAAEKQRTLKSN